jgi:hypothetical protein
MNEANIANTATILGRTTTTLLFTHWKTVVYNDPRNRAAIKINSLFITNRSANIVSTDVRITRNPTIGDHAVYNDNYFYAYLMNEWYLPAKTTVIAISRDNPLWLQPGDFLQISAGQNYSASATCSFEYVSDEPFVPSVTVTQPGPVMNLNAAPLYGGTEGVQLTWSPPLLDGGAPISNYLVLCRQRVVVSASPLVESWTDWRLVERPVSNIPSITFSDKILFSTPFNVIKGTTYGRDRLDSLPLLFNYAPEIVSIKPTSSIVGFEFAVAAHNSVELGPFSQGSGLIRVDAIGTVGDSETTTKVGAVEEISAAVSPNKVSLDWTGYRPKTEAGITIINYRVRWSHDSGMTWLPSPNGVETGSTKSAVDINGLENGLDYEFSLQAIATRTVNSVTQTIVGPWSPNTRVLRPPGPADEPQAIQRMETMFVRWVDA